jgi:hypothetical protein
MNPKRVTWLNLHHLIPQRDIRKLIYARLNNYDREVIECAHFRKKRPTITRSFVYYCAKSGYLGLLIWLRRLKCDPWSKVFFKAAKQGHLHIIQWGHSFGYNANVQSDICSIAATEGHLQLLRWVFMKDYAWDYKYICTQACRGGHINVLKWLKSKGRKWQADICKQICHDATLFGHFDILEWMLSQELIYEPEEIVKLASEKGHLNIVEWATSNFHSDYRGFCKDAAESGNMDYLKWALNHGFEFDEKTTFKAATNGHLDMLKYLIDIGCPFTQPHACYLMLTVYKGGTLFFNPQYQEYQETAKWIKTKYLD